MDHRPLTILLVAAAFGSPVRGEEKPIGWSAVATLSGVWTGGNTQTSTLGFKGRLGRDWPRAALFLEGGGLKQTDEQRAFFAVGTPSSFTVTERDTPTTQAESYFLDGGFERRVTERLFWSVGAGWRRDTFAGIERLLSARAGVGYVFWSEKDGCALKGALQVTLSDQQETIPNPTTDNTFVGLRAGLDFSLSFGPDGRNVYRSKLDLDENLQVTEDFRANWNNTLTVAMNARFALQVGAKQDYRNLPALREIDLFAAAPGPDSQSIGRVRTPFKKLDSIVTVALVINWGSKGVKDSLPKP